MMERIAFLGIGLMGAPMAANLLRGGFRLNAWNRTRAKAEALTEHGAAVAASAGAAVAGADVVVTMLESGRAVEAVLFGECHAANAIRRGSLIVDMSSIPPA